jgi:hypothetical protein
VGGNERDLQSEGTSEPFAELERRWPETHRFYEYKPMTKNEGIWLGSCVVHRSWVVRQDGPWAVKLRLLDTTAAGLHFGHALSETTVMVPDFRVFEFERHALLKQDVTPDLSSG